MPGAALLVSAACACAAILISRQLPRVWLCCTVAAAAAAFAASGMVLATGTAWEWRSAVSIGGELPHLRLDAISAWFLALLAVVGGSASIYTVDYWSAAEHRASAPRNRFWWTTLLLSMGGVLVAANGLHFLVSWEIFAVCSFFLITLEPRDREVRAAGWLYLAASHAGTLCLFAFFALLCVRTGSWDLGPMRERPELAGLFWLAIAGFGVKAGMFPLHIWLPSAHANAPSHVSAVLSGVAIKMGIYGLVRFSGWLPVGAEAGWVLMGAGAVTALLGIAFALAQNDFKRLLAYSSVENIGVILVGLGAALISRAHGYTTWGHLALAGALLHVWNHGLFKSLLFFVAGSVLHATGTREMSRLGGLWRRMPWTTALFALGAVAVCALPPLNGFVSEWLVYLGLFQAIASRAAVAWIAVPAAILLGVAGAMALATFVKAGATLFLGAPRTAAAHEAHESGTWMRAPMLAHATACAVLAAGPVLVWPLIAHSIQSWAPGWPVLSNPVASLGFIQLGIGLGAAAAAALLWNRARREPAAGPTWDCGYEVPTARMQYTSGSFAGIAAGWFRWILLPERKLRRPRGLFPISAVSIERVPETVLERGLGPVAHLLLHLSAFVRRLQHGRLQAYIAYVVIGLLGLAALVAAGVTP